MSNLLMILKTLSSLGILNIIRVGVYRIAIKSRIHPVQRISGKAVSGKFFRFKRSLRSPVLRPRDDWKPGSGKAFGQGVILKTKGPPDWFQFSGNPINETYDKPWWKIPDFDPNVGDIKLIWEVSRFDFLIPMAQRSSIGKSGEIERLNEWLSDWNLNNPPYLGINWKCGQEASIRVIHLIAAAWILEQEESPELALDTFIRIHLQRIFPTLGYAIGQANNHGTSEAAALFVGGNFIGGEYGSKLSKIGRRLLENRASLLIAKDGTFSQYSVVYHRLMLDTYSFAEAWRRKRELAPFSEQMMDRLAAATDWMEQLTCPKSGQVPNLGANDGTQILAFTTADARDFRPSLQLASTLFRGLKIEAPDPANQSLKWLGLPFVKDLAPTPRSVTLDNGGLHVLRSGKVTCYLRYPRFSFRPSQADALHLDLWLDGCNLIRDAGTYSYNSTPEDLEYFHGTESHSTIQFDQRDQMPRLGRFLFGEWLKADNVAPVHEKDGVITAAAAYEDSLGARHNRQVSLAAGEIIIRDTISGFSQQAMLRWRLMPGSYTVLKNGVVGEKIGLKITSDIPISNIALVNRDEALYYMCRTPLPVLEVKFLSAGEIVTTIKY